MPFSAYKQNKTGTWSTQGAVRFWPSKRQLVPREPGRRRGRRGGRGRGCASGCAPPQLPHARPPLPAPHSPTRRAAGGAGLTCAFPRPGPVIWAAAPAGCPSAERRVPGWPLLRAPRPPEPGRHPLPASRGPPRQTPPPSEAGAGREEPAGSGSPRGRDKVSGKRPDASRRRRGGGRASADLLPLRPSAPTTGATLLRP